MKHYSKNVLKKMQERGEKQTRLAEEIGVKPNYFGLMLKGERPWQLKYLERLAVHWDIPLEELVREDAELPVTGYVSAGEPVEFYNIEPPAAGWEKVLMPSDIPPRLFDRIYALKVVGSSMEPAFRDGTILYVKKDSGDEVVNGDIVVFVDQDGHAWVKKVKFSKDIIILKSINPAYEDMTIPISHKKIMDKVICAKWIY